ncbi:uncharacterized protein LOC115891663 isoform X2 [Sitophilus oryzae]|nr:uncharacterized protein LOC115891663 isoform X2 [Sitophilus oryzae]
MVTPVRRFQSLESVTNNTLRYARSPYHRPNNRSAASNNPHNILYYHNSSNVRIPRLERATPDRGNVQTSPHMIENNVLKSYICKFKFGLFVFAFMSVLVFFGANFLTTGEIWRMGVEGGVVIAIAFIVLMIGGTILLYLSGYASASQDFPVIQQNSNDSTVIEQNRLEETPPHQEPTANHISVHQVDVQELPPPPYHIAVRLSNQNHTEGIQILDDQSPPPPYEKAIT